MPSPFQEADAQTSDAEAPSDAGTDQAPTDAADAPELGHYCLDDTQCDDQIACTLDHCDLQFNRCLSSPDDQLCQNDFYCDGLESCDRAKGCVAGDPITCSDKVSCTIDSCVEKELSCAHVLRDADGDKDPDVHCAPGADCDDNDPTVNSLQKEICSNGRDDNCNGLVDEADCIQPQHDTCGEALALEFGKSTVFPMAGAVRDYTASCAPAAANLRDVVAAVTIPPGPAMDLDVVAQADYGQVLASLVGQCADVSSEIACGLSLQTQSGASISRFLARSLAPGSYPIYLFNDAAPNLSVTASLKTSSSKAANETCGTAKTITPGVPTSVLIVDAARDLGTSCNTTLGELVYSFTTGIAHDLRLVATSLDGYGRPSIGLRNVSCAAPTDELACKTDTDAGIFHRALPAGKWFVSVSSTAPSLISFDVILEDPSEAAPDETCSTAPKLTPGYPSLVSFDKHTSDIAPLCGTPSSDAAYTLSLANQADVLLLARYSQSDQGAVALLYPGCTSSDLIKCVSSYSSPLRVIRHALAAGDYRAAISSLHGNPASLTAFVRPAKPPLAVLFADRCDDAIDIGLEGGSFQGNTDHANADYPAGCDQSGGAAFGAPDQMLRLTLPEKMRVILDMQGSGYRTLLNVRRGPGCPGAELVKSCAVGYYDQRSFLDLTLEEGTYFLQIDGLSGETGPWKLDVFTSKP